MLPTLDKIKDSHYLKRRQFSNSFDGKPPSFTYDPLLKAVTEGSLQIYSYFLDLLIALFYAPADPPSVALVGD